MFFFQEVLCDTTIACDGHFYPVHKIVLSSGSEYFQKLFEAVEKQPVLIVLADIQHQYLETLLDYMYMGEVNVLQSELPSFMKVAERLKIRGLVENSDSASRKESGDNKRNLPTNQDGCTPKRRRSNNEGQSSPRFEARTKNSSADGLTPLKHVGAKKSSSETSRLRSRTAGHHGVRNTPEPSSVSSSALPVPIADLDSAQQIVEPDLTSTVLDSHDTHVSDSDCSVVSMPTCGTLPNSYCI